LLKIDVIDNIDDELGDVLPVVDAWWIGFPYAAGTVDYECYVHLTRFNMRYHTTRIIHRYYMRLANFQYTPVDAYGSVCHSVK